MPQGQTRVLETAGGPSEMQLEPTDGLRLGGHPSSRELGSCGSSINRPPGLTEGQRWRATPGRPGLPPQGCGGEPGGPR